MLRCSSIRIDAPVIPSRKGPLKNRDLRIARERESELFPRTMRVIELSEKADADRRVTSTYRETSELYNDEVTMLSNNTEARRIRIVELRHERLRPVASRQTEQKNQRGEKGRPSANYETDELTMG